MLMFKKRATAKHNHRWRARCIGARKAANTLWLNASDASGPFRGILLNMGLKLCKAERILLDKCPVLKPFLQDYMRHCQRERGVAAGWQQKDLVGVARDFCAARVDLDDVCAAFAGFDQMRGQVGLAGQRCPPEQDRL